MGGAPIAPSGAANPTPPSAPGGRLCPTPATLERVFGGAAATGGGGIAESVLGSGITLGAAPCAQPICDAPIAALASVNVATRPALSPLQSIANLFAFAGSTATGSE